MITLEAEWKPPLGNLDYTPVTDAMQKAGVALAEALRMAVSGHVFPGMSGPVSIENAQVSHTPMGAFEFMVSGPDLSEVEEGIKPWDMKPRLLAGPKHRVAKDGTRYNIIPFFHDERKMPGVVMALARDLSPSYVIGQYLETRSDDGAIVSRNLYAWGGQLGDMSALSAPGVSWNGNPRKTSRYSGMVNMHGSGYMTFRTVSDKSAENSWWHPGKPGNPVSESVWSVMEPAIEAHLDNAWEKVFASWWS